MEDFYRDARRRHHVLMDGAHPVCGRWNLDEENRQPPPADCRSPGPAPWWPKEDEIDEEVRRCEDADRIVEFRVMVRPLRGIEAVHEQMGRRLVAGS